MDEEFSVPAIATLPPPNGEPPVPVVESPEVEAMKKAAATVARFEHQRQEQAELIERSIKEIKKLTGELEWRELRIAELENNLQTLQCDIEAMREQNSELRAFFSEGHAQAKYNVARYEQYLIPLPVRKRVRNGKTNEASHALPSKSVDRPTIQSDQAA